MSWWLRTWIVLLVWKYTLCTSLHQSPSYLSRIKVNIKSLRMLLVVIQWSLSWLSWYRFTILKQYDILGLILNMIYMIDPIVETYWIRVIIYNFLMELRHWAHVIHKPCCISAKSVWNRLLNPFKISCTFFGLTYLGI